MKYAAYFGPYPRVLANRRLFQAPDHWLPPQSNPQDSAPLQDSANIFIDDVLWEISSLISLLPEDDRRQIHDNTNLPDGYRELLRVLSAQDCMFGNLEMQVN
jgi:hypothetical protein